MSNRLFNQIALKTAKRNVFDLSHERKFSMNIGDLVPMFVEEVVPGDTFKMNSEIFMRLAPLVAPIMHRVNVFTHFFFVPHRLVWDEWQDFITGGEDGQSAPVFPYMSVSSANQDTFGEGTLADYLGVNIAPPMVNPVDISALPFRGYQLIYNEYYRDQNLEEPVSFSVASGYEEGTQTKQMRKRAWQKDYFTAALPWTQRGGEATIPLGSVEPNYKNVSETVISADGGPQDGSFHGLSGNLTSTAGSEPMRLENLNEMEVEPTTINELRKAVKLQEWLEKSARGGSRYIEQIFSHFGVKSSDSRLQRPEYLGGGTSPVSISEVLQTSATNSNAGAVDPSVQGNMAGHGMSVGRSNSFKRFFEEHGTIIGIVSVMPKSAYQQGLRKQFFKFDKFDYFWPSFAHLGEQPIENKEIYNDGSVNSAGTFGYVPRYAEYKYIPNTVHGSFKSTEIHWHMGRKFAQAPVLNNDFLKVSDELAQERIFADTSEVNKLYVQMYNKVRAIRPMPKFGIPSL